jgi:hypothetical protein
VAPHPLQSSQNAQRFVPPGPPRPPTTPSPRNQIADLTATERPRTNNATEIRSARERRGRRPRSLPATDPSRDRETEGANETKGGDFPGRRLTWEEEEEAWGGGGAGGAPRRQRRQAKTARPRTARVATAAPLTARGEMAMGEAGGVGPAGRRRHFLMFARRGV